MAIHRDTVPSVANAPEILLTNPDGTALALNVPSDVWAQVPEERKLNEPDLIDYLTDALRIGVLSMVNASITIDTDRVQSMVDDLQALREEITVGIQNAMGAAVSDEDSALANALARTIGEGGTLQTTLRGVLERMSDPEHAGSLPAGAKKALIEASKEVRKELQSTLDITGESPLAMFVREERARFTDVVSGLERFEASLVSQIEARFTRIEEALNVDETLRGKEAEIEDLKDRGTHKGIHFENDATEALMDIAEVLGDRIEHKGGEGEGASRSKVGDIVIVIQHAGVPELRVAVEAKAGGISRKELVRQVRGAVENRNAVCGIGLMDQKHMGVRQHVIGQEAENFIIGVNWAEDDFLPLEVTYRMLRIMLIADALRLEQTDGLDVDGVKQSLEQAKTDLGMLQSMKSQTSTAISTLQGVRTSMDEMERKVRLSLTAAETLLRSE